MEVKYSSKVDKLLSESCAVDGEYCKFNRRFLNLLKKLESEKWFEEFSLVKGEPDFVYNKKKGRFEKVKTAAPFLKVEWISREVIWEQIKKVVEEYNNNRDLSTTDLLMQKLENFNFGADFNFEKERRKREAKGGKGGGPGGGQEEEREVANYTNINLKIKRFVTAINIMLPKLGAEGRKKRKSTPGREKRQAAPTVDCNMISNLAGILGMEDGGVREGGMFSYARISVSQFFNELLPALEWMAQQDLAECKKIIDKKYVYMVEVNLKKVETFLETKERSVEFQDRIR